MNQNIQPLVSVWNLEVAGDEPELRICSRKVMLGSFVAGMQSGKANIVLHIKIVQSMLDLRVISQAAKSLAVGERIGREIQNHAHARIQHVDNQRADDVADPMGQAHVVRH